MESSRSDHPSQTVNSSDRQPSQTVSCSDRQSSQTVSCSDRQPWPDTLPPGFSGADLLFASERQIARGDVSLQPNDRYTIWMPIQRFATQRQQDFVDEDVGREDGWQWLNNDGGGLQSEDSFHSVESPHALGDENTPRSFTQWRTLPLPPPCYKAPPTPRMRGPPAKPIDDSTGTVVAPPPFKPLPTVPGPPAQPRPATRTRASVLSLDLCDYTPTSDDEIPDLLEASPRTPGASPETSGNYRREKQKVIPFSSRGGHPSNLGGIDLNGEAEQMSDLTAPGADLSKRSSLDLLQRDTPVDCPYTKLAVLKYSYVPPSVDHGNATELMRSLVSCSDQL